MYFLFLNLFGNIGGTKNTFKLNSASSLFKAIFSLVIIVFTRIYRDITSSKPKRAARKAGAFRNGLSHYAEILRGTQYHTLLHIIYIRDRK